VLRSAEFRGQFGILPSARQRASCTLPLLRLHQAQEQQRHCLTGSFVVFFANLYGKTL